MNILEARRRILGGEVYRRTAEGNPISVKSVARMRPGLTVYGKSTQETTTGAQLFNYSNIQNVVTDVSGTQRNGEEISGLPAGQYTISSKQKTIGTICNLYAVVKTASGEFGSTIYIVTNNAIFTQTVTINNGNSIIIYDAQSQTLELSKSFFEEYGIMLNAGSTALPWEPYTGGQPSPSPDYPQEIKSAGDDGNIQVDIYGGNLINVKEMLNFTTYKMTQINLLPGDYIVSVENIESDDTDSDYSSIYIYGDETSEVILDWTNIARGVKQSKTFTVPNGKIAKLLYAYAGMNYGQSTGDNATFYRLMVSPGSNTLPYMPYKTPQTLTAQTPNGLPGIPVDSGGNYTDESGQQWVCDEVDFKRGKYVQRVKKASNITWKLQNGYDVEGSELFAASNIVDGINDGRNNMAFCTKLQMNPLVGNQNLTGFYQRYRRIHARIKDVSELAEFNQLMDNSEILYQLDAPIETDLSAEEVAAYQTMHTYSPVTTVTNDAEAWMRIDYKTKKSLEVNT